MQDPGVLWQQLHDLLVDDEAAPGLLVVLWAILDSNDPVTSAKYAKGSLHPGQLTADQSACAASFVLVVPG